jgi:hypothetical protein
MSRTKPQKSITRNATGNVRRAFFPAPFPISTLTDAGRCAALRVGVRSFAVFEKFTSNQTTVQSFDTRDGFSSLRFRKTNWQNQKEKTGSDDSSFMWQHASAGWRFWRWVT